MFSSLRVSALIISGLLSIPIVPAARHAPAMQLPSVQVQTAHLQAATGRITSVQGNTFTLEPQPSHTSARGLSPQDTQNVMTFTIDPSKTVEGKIEVGANADVTYREQDGNNIAVSVRVSAPQ